MMVTIAHSMLLSVGFWFLGKSLFTKTQLFQAERFYLLTVLCLIFLPFIPFSSEIVILEELHIPSLVLSQLSLQGDASKIINAERIWLLGSTVFFGIFLYRLYLILRLYQASVPSPHSQFLRFSSKHQNPCNFGQWIFLPIGLPDNLSAAIQQHEEGHRHYKHSIDIFLIAMVQIVLWWNPFVYLIGRRVRVLHEFQADAYANKRIPHYTEAILGFLKKRQTHIWPSSFNPLFIKLHNRIIMLQSQSQKTFPIVRLMLLAPVFTALLLFGCQKENPLTATKDLAQMPSFKGGQPELIQYMQEHLVYPKGVEKAETVQVQFVVSSNGSIDQVKAVSSTPESLNQAAVSTIENMPDWNPGMTKSGDKAAVQLVLPVQFSPR